MAQLAKLRILFGSAMVPAVAILLLLLFVGYAILGPSGILAWGDYSRQLRQRQAELDMLQAQKAALGNRIRLLDRRHADPDLVEELARRELGVLHEDEVVIPMK